MSNGDNQLEQVERLVFSFFVGSPDYNGITLRQISSDLGIEYEASIDLVMELVSDGVLSIQSNTNPHIIGTRHHPIEAQLKILDHAKSAQVSTKEFRGFQVETEDTDFPICVYPSTEQLELNRDVSEFGHAKYRVALALGEPQLSFRFFETEVLEQYSKDPRFDFKFQDFSGSIACKYDEDGNPILREEDQTYLKSFGLGFDSNSNRAIAVLLYDLGKLSAAQQVIWSTKEIDADKCKVLKDYYDNVIGGSWSSARSVFSAFIDEINAIYQITKTIFEVPMFREELSGDKTPRNFTFFFSPTSQNFYDFVNLLDKYISENINKAFFKGKIDLEEIQQGKDGVCQKIPKGTLRLLEEWLACTIKFEKEDAAKEIVGAFKKVRKERQKPAHKVIENKYDPSYVDEQKAIMEECYIAMGSIRRILQKHPGAVGTKLPEHIDAEDVKYF